MQLLGVDEGSGYEDDNDPDDQSCNDGPVREDNKVTRAQSIIMVSEMSDQE